MSTRTTTTEIIPGVTATNTTEITDWTRLGEFIADGTSEDQANLLAGIAAGFRGFGSNGFFRGLMQAEYIREALNNHPDREGVQWLIRELHIRINDTTEATR